MLQNYSLQKTAIIFFDEPTKEHYLIEISKNIGIAHTSVKKHLLVLEKTGIIKKHILKKGNRKYPIYIANIGSKVYIKYKRVSNIIKLIESNLIEFLKDKLMPRVIVLFGSYQRGEDTEESDIDIFVECKKEEIDLSKFRKILHRNIELHFKENFSEYPKELKNNIINGIILFGYLEVFR